MPANIRSASFQAPLDPTAQANLAAQQQQLELRQRMADALQQQANADPQVPAGSRMSWTQGAAKLVAALGAARMRRQNQADQWDMAAAQANALAAQHDPTGATIAPVDLAQNPFRRHHGAGTAPAPSPDQAPAQPDMQAQPAPGMDPQAGGAPPAQATPDMGAQGGGVAPDLANPAGRAEAKRRLALAMNLPGQQPPGQPNAGGIGSVAGADGAGAPALPTQGAPQPIDAGQQPASPADASPTPQALVAGLRAQADAMQGGPAQLGPETQQLLAGLRQRQDGQAAALSGAPAASAPQLSNQQHLANVDAHVRGEPVPHRVPDQPGMAPAQQAQQGAGQAGPQAQPAPVMDQLVPTMTARQAYAMQLTQPEAWGRLLESANTPVEAAKLAIAANIKPGTPEFQKVMRDALDKSTKTPVGDDKRGFMYDPYTGKPIGFHPQISSDATPLFDAQGNVVGEKLLAGANQITEAQTGARARGEAQGRLVQVYDQASGTMQWVPESTVLAGGGGGGFAAGAPMGTVAGADAAAKQSAADFQADAQAAAGAPQRRFLLNQIGELGRITGTGAGTPGMVEAKSHLNSMLAQAGMAPWFDNRGIARTQEIQKSAALLAQQQAAAYGGAGGATDAKLQAAFASLPDANKAPQAIQTIVGIMKAGEDAIQAKGQASAAYDRAHGATPTSHIEFSTQWTRNADPELFQRLAAARSNPAALTAGLNKQQANAMLAKYRALKNLGAF